MLRLRWLAPWFGLVAFACGRPDVDAAPQLLTIPSAQPGEVILDVRADGATLFGRVLPAPADTDGDRQLVLRSDLAGQPFAGALDGVVVLDARFVSEGLVVLGADHVLRVYAGQSVRELDAEAYGPLSVEADTVAYVRGDPPDLEVARADVRTGALEAITIDMAPTGSPALSADGREVIFVSGVEGSPRLYRASHGGVRALPTSARVPTAPSAPRWRGDALVMEDEAGVAVIDVRDGSVRSALATRDVLLLPDGRVVAQRDGTLAPIGGLQ